MKYPIKYTLECPRRRQIGEYQYEDKALEAFTDHCVQARKAGKETASYCVKEKRLAYGDTGMATWWSKIIYISQ